jgi:hypothetical protein
MLAKFPFTGLCANLGIGCPISLCPCPVRGSDSRVGASDIGGVKWRFRPPPAHTESDCRLPKMLKKAILASRRSGIRGMFVQTMLTVAQDDK